MQLKYPITFKGGTISELTFRRALVKDIKKMDKAYEDNSLVGGLTTIALLSGVPLEALDEMDGDDMAEAMQEMKGFLPKPREDATTG